MKSLRERFEDKYVIWSNGCWHWTACVHKGYGQFRVSPKRLIEAHRFSYELHIGEIPKGLLVLHKCNHSMCVNPSHLYLGNHSDNIADAIDNGRTYSNNPIGEDVHGAKLKNGDVICIKKMLRDRINRWLIAWIYQVDISTIGNINTKRTWRHIRI